jgi:hypothetical protein
MLPLQALAEAHGVLLCCVDGYELEPHELREALVLVLRAKRDEFRRIVARLEDRPGSPCPPIFVGELQAAQFGLGVVERDLAALLPRRVVDTTCEPLSGRRVG